jgi:transposase
MEAHTWKERTEDGTIIYRACHYAGQWKLETCPKLGRAFKDEEEWTPVEMTREHRETLRDILWRKYQRKRCPWEMIEKIDKRLEKMREAEEESQSGNQD